MDSGGWQYKQKGEDELPLIAVSHQCSTPEAGRDIDHLT
jgi:hypothetical protein